MTLAAAVAKRLLVGAVETHVHSGPDWLPRFPRKLDDYELVQEADEAGLAALVMKSHHTLTADRAQLMQKLHPGIRVFGGLSLNNSVGGLNPTAVQTALGFGAKVIWMPTISAAHQIKQQFIVTAGPEGDAGITVLDPNGSLRPEVITILKMIAQADAVLATGHLSPHETKVLVAEARALSVRRIIVTHPELPIVDMSLDDQRELATMGVYFERCFIVTTRTPPIDTIRFAEAVQAIGPESTIMATDFGQPHNPVPTEGLRLFIEAMLGHGFSEADVKLMVTENPTAVLGL